MNRRKVAILGVLGATLGIASATASHAAPVNDAAMAACKDAQSIAAEFGPIDGLVRAAASTAAEVVRWQEEGAPSYIDFTSNFRARPAGERVVICLFSGTFSTPTGPGDAEGNPSPPHTLLRLLLTTDGVIFDAAGHQGGLRPQLPEDLPASQHENLPAS